MRGNHREVEVSVVGPRHKDNAQFDTRHAREGRLQC